VQRVPVEWVRDRVGLPSTDVVYREARLGRLPHVHLGRRRIFYDEVILRWLEGQGVTDGTAEPAGAA
jgi:hypothetical protein